LGLLKQSSLTPEQLQRVNVAQSSGQSLLSLINDILDFSKIEANKLDLEIIDFNLHSMLEEFADVMAYTAQAKGLEFVLDANQIEESMVRGDPSRLRQILTNLVGNAIKFTSQGEIVIRAKVETSDEQDLQLCITVSDTGIGIPEEKLTSLFESFSQVDASTTREYGGTGLGLTIAKKLCELMNGKISVESQKGKGSLFEFTILLGKSELSEQVVPQIEVDKLHILIVDDNATNREVLRGQLEIWGASVTEAESAKHALSICEKIFSQNGDQGFFDVALLDMQMPEMDGESLGKLLIADQRFNQMKLIMMTSIASQGGEKKFTGLGFSSYFSKPTSASDLFNALAVAANNGKTLENATPLVIHEPLLKKDELYNWPEETRILLVDDNHINQLVAQGVLSDFGLQADIANNGKEALASLMQTHNTLPYTLILMDCQMPEMDGYEATRAIRSGDAGEQYKRIPILAMTANAMEGDKDKCLASGMNAYLSKPVNPEQLLNKLKQYLKLSTNENELVASLEPVERPKELAWDKEGALIRLGGNETLLQTLAGIFVRDAFQQISELKKAVDDGDCAEAAHLAHSIKGVSANLGGLKLQSAAAAFELEAKENNLAALQELVLTVEEADGVLVDLFNDYLESSLNNDQSNQESIEKLPKTSLTDFVNQLSSVYKSLEENDYIDPTELSSLTNADVSNEVQALVVNLIEKIKQFENSSAITILKDIESLSGSDLLLDKRGR